MKTSMKTFLVELYEIDPTLRDHEAEIIPLVEKLLSFDPAQEPDADFVKRLRMELREHASVLSEAPSSLWQKLGFALGGAVTAAVIIPLAFVAMNKSGMPALQPGESLFGYGIEEKGERAFGSLVDTASETQAIGRGDEVGMGGGGGGGGDAVSAPAMAPVPSVIPEFSGTDDTDQKMMIAPWPMVTYDYVFEGDMPVLTDTVSVYKRMPSSKRIPLSSLLGSLNLGTVDLSSFQGMNMDSLQFSEDRDFGYNLYVSLRDASVNIDAQWEKWPQSRCSTDACYQAERVKITDIPGDDVLLGITRDFVSDHGVDLSQYGEPEVDHLWKEGYDRMMDKSQMYIPETMRVVFPLLLDGEKTYDQGGQPMGISIGVHVKHRRVMNAYGIMDRSYQKSGYAGVTDEAKVKEYLSTIDNGNGDPASTGGQGTQTVTVKLGTPTVANVTHYRYANNMSEELLVPSLIFPVEEVTGMPDEMGWYYRSRVIVPLAEEMLDEQMKQRLPMPLY